MTDPTAVAVAARVEQAMRAEHRLVLDGIPPQGFVALTSKQEFYASAVRHGLMTEEEYEYQKIAEARTWWYSLID